MAFTKTEREGVMAAFGSYTRAAGLADPVSYLLDLVTRSRARQKTEMAAWLAAETAEQQAGLSRIDADAAAAKVEREARLAALAAIDVTAAAD